MPLKNIITGTFFDVLSRKCRFVTTISLRYSDLTDSSLGMLLKADLKFIMSLELSNNHLTAESIKLFGNYQLKYL